MPSKDYCKGKSAGNHALSHQETWVMWWKDDSSAWILGIMTWSRDCGTPTIVSRASCSQFGRSDCPSSCSIFMLIPRGGKNTTASQQPSISNPSINHGYWWLLTIYQATFHAEKTSRSRNGPGASQARPRLSPPGSLQPSRPGPLSEP